MTQTIQSYNYYRAHREEILQRSKKNRIKNKAAGLKAERSSQYLKKYGISELDVIVMWQKQEHKCAICRTSLVIGGKKKNKACIDHNHETKKVREIICDRCHTAIGLFNDNPTLVEKALNYLIRHSVSQTTKKSGLVNSFVVGDNCKVSVYYPNFEPKEV